MDISKCGDQDHADTIIQGVHGNGGDDGKFECCTNDGCNWNGATAALNLVVSRCTTPGPNKKNNDRF